MKASLIIFSLAFLASNTHARINETFEECTKRYGDPIHATDNVGGTINLNGKEIKILTKSAFFEKNSFSISAQFYENICYKISFAKPLNGTDHDLPLKDEEISLLLSKTGFNKWKSAIVHKNDRNRYSETFWFTEESRKITATHYRSFMGPEMLEIVNTEIDEELRQKHTEFNSTKNQLKGF